MSANFTKANAKAWMKANKHNHVDPKTGEVNTTSLAEDCADFYNVNDEGGPLDDELHWIWEVANLFA